VTCYDSDGDGDVLESSAQRQLHLHSFPLGNSSKIHRAKYSSLFFDSLFILSFKYRVVVSFFVSFPPPPSASECPCASDLLRLGFLVCCKETSLIALR
jgi:hypothetical protein